jgi:hypothetical protein
MRLSTRFRRVIDNRLRPRTEERRHAEVNVAGRVPDRMLDLGCAISVRIV